MCGLFSGILAVLVYGPGFTIAKRINERRQGGNLRNAPGAKRSIFGLLMLLVDAAIADAAAIQTPFFGSGDFVIPASTGQLLYDLSFLASFHWIGLLGFASLVWGLVVFCRHDPATRAPAQAAAALTESPTPAPTKSKARFCKLCGDPIDPVTRKCTGCKKQYFRLPVFADKHYFIAATAVACAVVVLLLVALVSQRSSYEAQIAELNTRISELEGEATVLEQENQGYEDDIFDLRRQITNQKGTISSLNKEIESLTLKASFFDRHAVIVLDDGTKKYHTFDCMYRKLSDDSFWIYNTEAAEGKGYKPCSLCCD